MLAVDLHVFAVLVVMATRAASGLPLASSTICA